MAVEVTAPKQLGPARFGLLGTLGSKPLPDRVAADNPIVFVEESCEDLNSFDLTVCPVAPVVKPAANQAIRGISDEFIPHGAYLSLSCSSVANSQALADERALSVYNRNIEFFIGQQFYQDLLANPILVAPVAGSPSCVLSLAQNELYSISGRSSVIFAPPAVVSAWSEGHGIHEEDGKLYTALGNLVVIIPEPTGTYTVFVGDSLPDIYLGKPQLLNSDAAQQLRTNNSIVSVVENTFVVTTDFCVLVSYEVELCV